MCETAEIARLIDSYVSRIGAILNSPERILSEMESTINELEKIESDPERSIPREQEVKMRWGYQLSLIKSTLQTISLSKLIDAMGELPVVPVIVDDPKRQQYISNLKTKNKQLSLLLKILVAGESMPPEGIPLEVYFHYGLAQLIKARFNLATETYIRSPLLQIFFPSAAVLWICCLCSDIRWELEVSGAIGTPTIPGKTDYLSHQGKGIQKYMDSELKPAPKPHECDWTQNLSNSLYLEAYKIAQIKANGYFEEYHYRPFFKLWQRFNNKVLRREELQSVHVLPDERSFTTGKNNIIPKGFHPKESSAWQPSRTKRRRKL